MRLMQAADHCVASGQMTAANRDELAKVAAIDWKQILSLLPLLATFIPALAPIIPFIQPLVTFILNLINGGLNIVPPTPPIGGDIPTPH